MQPYGKFATVTALGAALMFASQASAAMRGGGFHGGGFRGGGFHGAGIGARGIGARGVGVAGVGLGRSAAVRGVGWRGAGWAPGVGRGYWRPGLAAAGVGLGLATAPFWGSNYGYSGYPGYAGYGYPGYAWDYNTTAPVETGRSVAVGQIGNSCQTPVKTCLLYSPADVGIGCSCRVPGGRARGSVIP